MSTENETAALGVGAQHGDGSKGQLGRKTGDQGYPASCSGSTVLPFRPRRDAILIEYAVTHWRVSRVHAGTGIHTVLGCAAAIVTAAAYARSTARRYGAPIILGPGAAGWRDLMQEAA